MLLYQISLLDSHTLTSNCGKRGCGFGRNIQDKMSVILVVILHYFSLHTFLGTKVMRVLQMLREINY